MKQYKNCVSIRSISRGFIVMIKGETAYSELHLSNGLTASLSPDKVEEFLALMQ
ncbi:MAG: hypothetical protein KF781_11615 [Chitinophagaceae bacterium]|nr:hypothetical protein [Chitinophagaceae bacterium]MCW5906084.1 hypothetical protein [Chitinophagaceae bacterium]